MRVSGDDIPAVRLVAQTILTELGRLLTAARVGAQDRPYRSGEVAAHVASTATTEHPKSVNTEQASKLLGNPTGSVRRLIRIGELRAVQLGRYYVIPIEEINRILTPTQRAVQREQA
jgi:excisionase family DNA binding protein